VTAYLSQGDEEDAACLNLRVMGEQSKMLKACLIQKAMEVQIVVEKGGCFSWLAIFTSRGFYLEYSSGIIFQTFRAGLCRNHSDSARRESGEAGCGPGKGLARD